MPDELATQLGQPAARARVRPVEAFILAFLVLLAVLLIVTFGQNSKLINTQRDGVTRGYVSRAVTCDLQKGLGLHESKGCSDPKIAPYRDAKTGASSSTGATESRMTRQLVCLVLQQAAKVPGSTIVIPAAYCPPAS